MAGVPISQRALNRALLARQALLRRERVPALEMIRRLAGIQSQAPLSPYAGLWTRIEGFRHEDLGDLLTGRTAIRIVLMRSTIHLVTADDALAWRPLLQPVIERTLDAAYKRRLGDVDRAAVTAAGRALVEERPLTFQQLGQLLNQRWPDHPDPAALAEVIRAHVPLVQLPPRGLWGQSGPAAHTSTDAWLGRPLDPNPSLPEMIRRYLASYGPASAKDAQAWSGRPGMAATLSAMRDELVTFRNERGVELFDLPDAPRPDPEIPAPVRYLSEFENAFISYADRTRIISEEDRLRVFTVNGIVRATFLIDGVVHGLWRVERESKSDLARLIVEPFRPIPATELMELEAEGTDLLSFVAPDAAQREITIMNAATS